MTTPVAAGFGTPSATGYRWLALLGWMGSATSLDARPFAFPKDERQYVTHTLGSPGHPLALFPSDEPQDSGTANPSSTYDILPWFGWVPVPMDF